MENERLVITGNFVNIKVLCEVRFEPPLFYRAEKTLMKLKRLLNIPSQLYQSIYTKIFYRND